MSATTQPHESIFNRLSHIRQRMTLRDSKSRLGAGIVGLHRRDFHRAGRPGQQPDVAVHRKRLCCGEYSIAPLQLMLRRQHPHQLQPCRPCSPFREASTRHKAKYEAMAVVMKRPSCSAVMFMVFLLLSNARIGYSARLLLRICVAGLD